PSPAPRMDRRPRGRDEVEGEKRDGRARRVVEGTDDRDAEHGRGNGQYRADALAAAGSTTGGAATGRSALASIAAFASSPVERRGHVMAAGHSRGRAPSG